MTTFTEIVIVTLQNKAQDLSYRPTGIHSY